MVLSFNKELPWLQSLAKESPVFLTNILEVKTVLLAPSPSTVEAILCLYSSA